MSPTSGVIGEAWQLYKTHWRHLIALSFVVYVAVALIGALLTAALTWLGVLIALFVSGTLTAPFIAVVLTLLYFRLRAAKEPAAEPAPTTPTP